MDFSLPRPGKPCGHSACHHAGDYEDYPSQADARRAAEGLRLQINSGLPLREAVTFQGLLDRYVSEEIELGELAHTTKEVDLSRINKHISPKWGKCLLKDVKPYLVQDWLRKLSVAPKTKGHLRGLMYRLFEKAMLWELTPIERNPMGLVELKGVSKRLRARILTEEEFVALFNQLLNRIDRWFFSRLHRAAHQRGLGFALAFGGFRASGHGRQGRLHPEPGHETQVRIFAGRTAFGPGRCDHSPRMETALPGIHRRLGFPSPRTTKPYDSALCARRC